MWPKEYKDYPEDEPLKKEQLEPGKGIIGCEMHDLNGWGHKHHVRPKPKPGFIRKILNSLFGGPQ